MPDDGGDRLGHDQRQPHDAERVAQADEDRRQRAGQDDPPEQRAAAKPVDPRHLDQAAVDGADAVEGVEVDREQHADRDQEDLGLLADPEPQDDQRDDREMRHVAQHLQRGVEQPLGRPRQMPLSSAEDEADAAADDEARSARARVLTSTCRAATPLTSVLPERPRDGAGRRQHARRQPARRRRPAPRQRARASGSAQRHGTRSRRRQQRRRRHEAASGAPLPRQRISLAIVSPNGPALTEPCAPRPAASASGSSGNTSSAKR